jgi:hypothetical protein
VCVWGGGGVEATGSSAVDARPGRTAGVPGAGGPLVPLATRCRAAGGLTSSSDAAPPAARRSSWAAAAGAAATLAIMMPLGLPLLGAVAATRAATALLPAPGSGSSNSGSEGAAGGPPPLMPVAASQYFTFITTVAWGMHDWVLRPVLGSGCDANNSRAGKGGALGDSS